VSRAMRVTEGVLRGRGWRLARALPWVLVTAVSLSGRCMSATPGQMVIERQVVLSPGHYVGPYRVIRASNGDLIAFGSNSEMGFRPWATRVSARGEIRWEYVAGGPNGWEDRSVQGQKYVDVLELPDQTTLLCGIKDPVGKDPKVWLDRLALDGSLIEEHLISLGTETEKIGVIRCFNWQNTITIMGTVGHIRFATGFLAQLDEHFNVRSQKLGNQYATDEILLAADGGLYLLNRLLDFPTLGNAYLLKLGADGQIIARQPLVERELPSLVHPVASRTDVRVVYRAAGPEIVTFDAQLRPIGTFKLRDAGVRSCVELPDGSTVIFGSQFRNEAFAAATWVDPKGNYKGFMVHPPEPGFYYDAVATGSGNEFAATRLAGIQAVLEWVVFK